MGCQSAHSSSSIKPPGRLVGINWKQKNHEQDQSRARELRSETNNPVPKAYGGNTCRYEPEVLAARQHVGRIHEHGERLERVLPPELLLAVEVVVRVQRLQHRLAVLIQLRIVAGGLEVEAGVEGGGVLGVADQADVLRGRMRVSDAALQGVT
jgi:hypothetical protein